MDRTDTNVVKLAVGFFAFVLIVASAWNWYKAGAQSAQYERQGIHLSQWDVFIGVKPAEQVVQIRESR